MTAAKLPGGSAGLLGPALVAAIVTFGLGSGCSPSTGNTGAWGGGASASVTSTVPPPGAGGNGSAGAVQHAGAGATSTGNTGSGAGAPGGAPPAGGTGTAPPPGGSVGSGGTTGFAGQPALGGTCNMQVVDPTPLPACPSCQGGRCVNPADYPTAPASLLSKCSDGTSICLPDPLVATKGNVALPRCTSVAGGEGRCTSLCIPLTASLAGFLPQDTCQASERCAPCYNPVDGSSTGICNIGCDPGPTAPPVVFPPCCVDKGTNNARGRCVPRSVIPDGPAKANLAKETCSGNNDPVCVPTAIIQDPTYKFPMCTSQLFLDPGKPGVCAPACIVNANPAGAALAQDDCANKTDKCVPCTNPSTGQPSGACP